MLNNSQHDALAHYEELHVAIIESIEHRQLLGGISTALLALLVYYNSSGYEPPYTWHWTLAVFAVSLFKTIIYQCSKKRVCKKLSLQPRNAVAIISAALTGVLWSASINFINISSTAEFVMTTLIISGIMTGSINAYLGQLRCVLCISTPISISIIICLFTKISPTPYAAISSVIVFYLFIYLTCIYTRDSVHELLLAKHEKGLLINRLQDKQKLLSDMARTDALTGLPNRRLLAEQFENLANGFSHNNEKFAALFIDMNNFKLINDEHGHEVGDKALILLADTLRNAVRKSDVVARLGGDEFIVIVKNVNSKDEVDAVTQKITESLEITIDVDSHKINASASIGVSVYPDDGNSLEALINAADASMFCEKRKSRMK